jgi:RNA polymerase sigma factor (sigma-70 family)
LTPTSTDSELIAMCKADLDAGYTGLYQRYAKRIFNSIHRIVSHTAVAEDLLQETFLAGFKELKKTYEIKNFEAWLKRVAINKSISHLRKNKIQFSDITTMEVTDADEYDLHENVLFERKLADVRESIAQLPTGYRTIISLYLFENIPQNEIAVLLDLSPHTVRTQYHRAKKKILTALQDKVYHE